MTAVSQEVVIQNLKGLHARATAAFVKLADTFDADITVQKGQGAHVSAKSIMGLLMLAAALGDTIKISATGVNAQNAVTALVDLVNNKFGEDA